MIIKNKNKNCLWCKLFIGLVCLLLFSKGTILSAATTQLELQMAPFPVPANLTATVVSANQIDLNWSAVSIAVSYKVYRNGSLIASPTTTSYSDTGVSPGITYSYTVSAVNIDGGESKQSSSVSAVFNIGGWGGIFFPLAPELSPSPLSPEAKKTDANNDNKVNFLDFNILMANWGAIGPNIADFSGDGIVDLFDFNLLMIYWTI